MSRLRHCLSQMPVAAFLLLWVILWTVAALSVHLSGFMNLDNASMLYASERLVAGEKPYVDFYEVNPPLILWIYALPVLAANIFAIDAIPAFFVFVMMLALTSLSLAYREMQSQSFFDKKITRGVVFSGLAITVLGCSGLLYGQREHFFILLILPYFIQSLTLAREREWGMRQMLIALMAGIGFSIKPFFVLVWGANELIGALAARRLRLLCRPTNIVIGLTGVTYIGFAYWLTPNYFSLIIPYLQLTYIGFNAPFAELFKAGMLLAVMYALPQFFVKTEGSARLVKHRLLACMIAGIAILVMQTKGWVNHYYPMMFFGSLSFAVLLAYILERKPELTLRNFALMWCMGFVVFLLPVFQLAGFRESQAAQKDYIAQIEKYVIQNRAQGKPLLILSYNLGAAFPAMNYLPVTFPFHFHSQWLLPGIAAAEKAGGATPELDAARQFAIDTLAGDLERLKPPVVVVDNNNNYIEDFSRDDRFSALWKNYRQAGKIDVQKGGDIGIESAMVFIREE
jgi:hypothetical protein